MKTHLHVRVRCWSSAQLSFSACDLVRTLESTTDLFLATGFGAYLSFGALLNFLGERSDSATGTEGDGDRESSSSLQLFFLLLPLPTLGEAWRHVSRPAALDCGFRSVLIGVKKGEE